MSKSLKPSSTPKLRQHVLNILPSSCSAGPSPPVTLATPSFRKPIFPASAAKDAITAARNVRASSQASVSTTRASSTARSQRNPSVASRVSSSSRTTATKGGKREVVDISSDEDESDYAPDSSDDEEELESSLGEAQERKFDKNKMRKCAPGPVPKKAKIALNSKCETKNGKNGKNGFGFQTPFQPKLKANNQPVPSSQNTSTRPPSHITKPPTLKSPSLVARKPKKATYTVSPRRPQRSSKVTAKSKIAMQLALDEESLVEEHVAQADANEAPECSAVEDVRGGLRSMSFTPAPSDATEDIGSLVETEVSVDMGVALRPDFKGDVGWESWMRKRVAGDRFLARTGEDGADEDEYCEVYEIKKDEQWQARSTRRR